MVSAIVTMGTGAKGVTCPMTTSANIGLVTFSPIAPIHSVPTFAHAVKVTLEMGTNAQISTSVKTPPSARGVSRTQSVATCLRISFANVSPASKGMEKSSAETSTNV
jgi:hypothetical protein